MLHGTRTQRQIYLRIERAMDPSRAGNAASVQDRRFFMPETQNGVAY